MTTTATLVSGSEPRSVQIVVSATTNGLGWTVTGTAGGYSWTVPGGVGVGDGNQLVLVDNRGPLNVPITYKYRPATGVSQFASPITVTSATGTALQSLDGQMSVPVDLLDESGALELLVNQAVFTVPGRRRPVVRYSTTGDGGGSLHIGMESAYTATFRELCASGSPVLVRRQAMSDDMPLVFVALFTQIASDRFATDIGYREWTLPYLLVDDPFMDTRLGASSWSDFDLAIAGDSWAQFDSAFAGKTWNQFDTQDWSIL